METSPSNYVQYIMVFGFHHKKGSQIEYCYPKCGEKNSDNGIDLPDVWKHLPTLALPDGSHNFDKDSVYFILPSLTNETEIVFGVCCYQQVNADTIANKTPDITRGSIQKSVVVISSVPLFGAIEMRLEGVTQAYFQQADFSTTLIFEELFTNLSQTLTPSYLKDQIFTNLSARDLLLRYRNNLLLLFKLILLERRVIFFMTPIKLLTGILFTLLSLFPDLLSSGLSHCTHIDASSISLASFDGEIDGEHVISPAQPAVQSNSNVELESDQSKEFVPEKSALQIGNDADLNKPLSTSASANEGLQSKFSFFQSRLMPHSVSATALFNSATGSLKVHLNDLGAQLKTQASPLFTSPNRGHLSTTHSKHVSSLSSSPAASSQGIDSKPGHQEYTDPPLTCPHPTDEWGFPLAIFTRSSLFYPYVSLHHIDILENPSVRSFVIGANNMLYKSRRHLVDVVVGDDEASVNIEGDLELKRALTLTAADLRFTESLLSVIEATSSSSMESGEHGDSETPSGWEGSDDWIRSQFRIYLEALLLSTHESKPSCDDFNLNFVRLFRRTATFRMWRSSADLNRIVPSAESVSMGGSVNSLDQPVQIWEHPGHRQWQMNDIKLRVNHLLTRSEQGRKINTAVQQTGKALQNTGKTVGVALNQAKSAVSSFWSGFSRPEVIPSSKLTTDSQPTNEIADGDNSGVSVEQDNS